MRIPREISLDWPRQYRIIPSIYPPIDFFENLVDSDLMDELHYIESLTNERLRDEVGDISLVSPEDRFSGPGSSPVMAAFTHISLDCPNRFSDGSYGVYYAAKELETAIEETKHHRAKFLSYTKEEPGKIEMRVYVGQVVKPLHDIRKKGFEKLHDPNNWNESQKFGKTLREKKSWGIVYHSVRHQSGYCIAALRPPAVSIPTQGPHLTYVWDGNKITNVLEMKELQ